MPLFPPPVRRLPGYWSAYGHSYCMTTVGTLYQSGRMDAIVRDSLYIEQLDWQNHCVTGAQVTNQGRSQGGYARVLQEVTKSQRTSPYAANGGGALFVWGINDIGISGNSATVRGGWKNAMRACISRWRASSVKEDSDASISWGAGWVNATSSQDFTSGTTFRNATATTNANGTITLPADYAGQVIALCFVGAGGAFGGDITFSGTASFTGSIGTVTTDNAMPSATHCPIVRRVQGTAADAGKTIIMTVSRVSASGGVGFDCYWLEADNPPPVIVCNIARLTTAGYAGYATWSGSQAGADTDVANFNSDLASVVAEFDSMVQIADIDTPLNKGVPPAGSPAGVTTLFASDGVHPNEYGAALCADAVITAVNRLAPPGVLGTAAYMQVDAPQAGAVRLPRLSGQWYMPEFGAWDGSAYTGTALHLFAVPVVVTEGRERWIQAQFEVTNAPTTGSSIRWGIYDDVGWTGYPQDLVVEFTSGGALAIGTTAAMKQSPASGAGSVNQALDPGLYWLALKMDAIVTTAPTFRCIKGPSRYMSNGSWVSGTQGTDMGWRVTASGAGALPTTFPTGAVAVGTTAGTCPAIGYKIN